MVKNKPQRKKKRGRRNENGTIKDPSTRRTVKTTKKKYDIDQLLDKADECMEQLDIETAKLFCERAVQVNPDHPRALEVMGNLLLEVNDLENAAKCWGRAITVDPENGSSKYLNLAQTMEGKEAVELFKKGIEILMKEKDSSIDELKPTFDSKISSAYCSIAEIYLTDLCFEENAETSCKQAIEKALEYDSNSAEAYQLNSSFLMSTCKPEESKKMLENSLNIWFKKDEESSSETDVSQNLPPFPLRLSAAKLLIEHKEYLKAFQVIEQLIEEDDEEIELWYLGGSCHYYLHTDKHSNNPETSQSADNTEDQNKTSAAEYFSNALKLMVKLNIEDEDLYSQIIQMLKELGYKGDEKEFDLKHLKTVLKCEKTMSVMGMIQENAAEKEDSDNESLTASDQEFLNNFADSDSEDDDMDTGAENGAGCSSSNSKVITHEEEMEEN